MRSQIRVRGILVVGLCALWIGACGGGSSGGGTGGTAGAGVAGKGGNGGAGAVGAGGGSGSGAAGAGGKAGSGAGATGGAGQVGGAGGGADVGGHAGAGTSGGAGGAAGHVGGAAGAGGVGGNSAGAGGGSAGAGGVGGNSAGAGGSSAGAGGGVGGSSAGTGGGSAGTSGGIGGGSAGAGGGTGGVGVPLVIDFSTLVNPASPGGHLPYTITVGNISNAAVDAVTVSLTIPVGVQFQYANDAAPNANSCGGSTICTSAAQASWSLGTIAAGDTRTIEINASVLSTVADGAVLNSSVRLSATGVNPIIINKSTAVQMQITSQLSVGTTTDPALPGQRLTLDLDLGQLGMTALANSVLQTTLPAGLTIAAISDGGTQSSSGVVTWSIGSVGVGVALHRQVDVTVDANVPAGSILKTRTTLTYDGGASVDAAAELPITVVPTPPIITTTVAIGPSPTTPSGHLNLIVTIANRGTRAVDGIGTYFRVPAGIQFQYANDAAPNATSCNGSTICVAGAEAYWSLGTLAAGASTTISIGSAVLATVVGNGNLMRFPFRTSGTGVSEVRAVKTVQVFDSPGAQLDLGTTANPITNNQAFVYNVDVGQIGANALANAQVRVRLPAGLTLGTISNGGTQDTSGDIVWSLGTVGVGAYVHRTIAVTADGTASPGTVLNSRATLTFDGGAAIDNIAEYAVSVIAAAQPVTLDVTATPSPAVPGNKLLYTMTITNTSARSVDGVGIFVRLPIGLQFQYANDAEPNATSCGGIHHLRRRHGSLLGPRDDGRRGQPDHHRERLGADVARRRQPHPGALLSELDGGAGAGATRRRRSGASLAGRAPPTARQAAQGRGKARGGVARAPVLRQNSIRA